MIDPRYWHTAAELASVLPEAEQAEFSAEIQGLASEYAKLSVPDPRWKLTST